MDDAAKNARDLAEAFQDQVYNPSAGVNLSTGYASLRIDMTLMGQEEREKVYEAERLLSEAGVTFDMNSGEGFRTWELDWSLSGAVVDTKALMCSAPGCPNEATLPNWAVYFVRAGRVLSYAYCSDTCREADVVRLQEEREWTCLLVI